MAIFFTSDNHFGHHNIIAYCGRPFKNVDHMDRVMIENWNSIVKPEDTVFHLGDMAFHKKVPQYIEQLNGNIIWVKGNHDKSKDVLIREMIIKYGGREWTLIHDPAFTMANNVICGHVHEKWKIRLIKDRTIVNVGVDVWDFKPIQMTDILKRIAQAQREEK